MMANISVVSFFTLSGINETAQNRVVLFSLTLLCYLVILMLNISLVLTIILDQNLHQPMYIFLCNLCLNALYGTAGFYPKFLLDLISSYHVISYAGCLLQGFVIYSSVCIDFSILALMSYDRYVAICRPLDYQRVMTKRVVAFLASLSWVIPLGVILMSKIEASTLSLCGSHIDKLYCANWLMVKLACSSVTVSSGISYFTIALYLCHFLFIFLSYMYLIRTCVRSIEVRGKFMQTCVPHLLALLNVTTALLFDVMFMRFSSSDLSQGVRNFLSIEFLIVPPIVNPLIYGFKLTQIRHRILRFVVLGPKSVEIFSS